MPDYEEIRERNKAEKKLRKERTNFSKQRFVEIRTKIISSLSLYPKTIDELSKDIHSNFLTTEKHLNYLSELGVVCMNTVKIKRRERNLWFVVKR